MSGRRLAAPALLGLAVGLAGCNGLTPSEERVGGGALIGTAGGAAIGAIAGNAGLGAAIGLGAGVIGGVIYDQVKRQNTDSYNAGYQQATSRAQASTAPPPFLQFNFPVQRTPPPAPPPPVLYPPRDAPPTGQ